MRGIEPPMSEPRRRVAAGGGSGGEALFHLVDSEGPNTGHQTGQALTIDLEQARFFDGMNRCLPLLFRKSLPAPFQFAFVLCERRALLFQCTCHRGLLVHADRAMNEGYSIGAGAMLEGKDEAAARRGEAAQPPGSIR
ncbi:hypothetical protein TZ53_23750 (plasmid) [Sphingobium sp. YBL2]|nr:hypothetical protein TZ53_23750 [Sphingobium sp. YBL2]